MTFHFVDAGLINKIAYKKVKIAIFGRFGCQKFMERGIFSVTKPNTVTIKTVAFRKYTFCQNLGPLKKCGFFEESGLKNLLCKHRFLLLKWTLPLFKNQLFLRIMHSKFIQANPRPQIY